MKMISAIEKVFLSFEKGNKQVDLEWIKCRQTSFQFYFDNFYISQDRLNGILARLIILSLLHFYLSRVFKPPT